MTNLRLKPSFLMTAICSLCVLNSGVVADVFGDSLDAYHKVDIRTAWNAAEIVTLDLTVENLLDGEHKEWNSEQFISGTKIPRMFYDKVTLDF